MTGIDSRYKRISTLGSGGMGTVYLAESKSLGTLWAIKAIDKYTGSSIDLLAEPNILKRLSHPALPRIVDIEEDDRYIYIVEDYIPGTALDRRLEQQKVFGEAIVLDWAKQLCEVLIYLHSQKPNPIIYRDMKPANIIVGDDNRVKLIDFGIAREYRVDGGSDTTYLGTRGYAAPEQYGTAQTDARTDIYSLGVTLYHLLSGKHPNDPPYEFKRLCSHNPTLSEGIDHIVNKCVQGDPANRYQSAAELLWDLQNIHLFNSAYRRQALLDRVRTALQVALIAGFAALSLAGFRQLGVERENRYQALLAEGYAALLDYEFNTAHEAFSAAGKVYSVRTEAYFGVAQVYLRRADFEQCIEYLENKASTVWGLVEEPAYHYLMGTAYFEQKQYQSASFYLERAAALAPTHTAYSQDLAVCYAKMGKLTEARKLLDTISHLAGRDDAYDYVNAQVLLAEGKRTAAIAALERSIKTTKDPSVKRRAYLELAGIYKAERQSTPSAITRQIEVLEQAIKQLEYNKDIAITEMLGEAYFAARSYKKSVDAFNSLLAMGYTRPHIYLNIAIIQQQTGDYQNAAATLAALLEQYPQDYRGYLRLALLFIEAEGKKPETQRDYKKVQENYNKAVKYSPQGENTGDLLPLRSLIKELRDKGWLP